MKNINNEYFNNKIRNNYKHLIISIVFLVISIIFLIIGKSYDSRHIMKEELMNDIKLMEKESNKKAYIEVATKPYLFAIYKTDGKEEKYKYYIVMDQQRKLYVIYIDDETYEKLDTDDINIHPVKISGVAKLMPLSILEHAIKAYNDSVGEELLNNDNYLQYLGVLYLDTTPQIEFKDVYYFIFLISILISFFIFLIFIKNYIINVFSLKKLSVEDKEKIESEIIQLQNEKYKIINLYLASDYLIDLTKNIKILNYKDIVWAYSVEKRKNGLLIGKHIRILTKDKKIYDVAYTKEYEKDKEDLLKEVLEKIKEKNNDILLGYNNENKQEYLKKIKYK